MRVLGAAAGGAGLGFGRILAAAETAEKSPASKTLFSFGVVTDIQYADTDPQLGRYYRESVARLEECVKQFNALKPGFIMQLGDLINTGFEGYDAVLPVLAKLTMPTHHVLGNHEFAVDPGDQEKVLPRLGLDKVGGKKGYYDFAPRAGWRLVVLDGNDISLWARPPGSDEHKAADALYDELQARGARNAQVWNGAVGKRQLEWLAATLAKAAAAGEKSIVFCHFPVHPPTAYTLWNDSEVMKVLESAKGVVAYFSGHDHKGDYAEKRGIHYLTFAGMVETRETAYAMVEVSADSIKVTGFGRQPSQVLRIAP